MDIVRAIRQLRQQVGLEPAGFSDFIAPAVGILAVGMLAGAGIALLIAPTTGKKLREEMEHKFSDLRSRYLLQQGDTHATHRNNVAQPTETYPRS